MRFLSANGFLPICECKSTNKFSTGKKKFTPDSETAIGGKVVVGSTLHSPCETLE